MNLQDGTSFTLFDVLGDAFASFRRTIFSHMKLNLLSLALIFLSSCLLACILVPVVGAMVGAAGTFMMQAGEGPDFSPAVLIMLGLLYLALLVVYALGYAMHQGATFALTDADLQGRVVDLRVAVSEATSRVPTLFAVVVLRFLCDVSFLVFFGTVGVALVLSSGMSLIELAAEPWAITAFVGLYLGSFVWMLVVRAFLGLSGPAAQYEAQGPIGALGRSFTVLRGHRLQMFFLRIVWGLLALLLYVIAYVPIAGITFFSALNQPDPSNPAAALLPTLVLLPVFVLWYYFVLHILSFDSVIEGAFFRRLVQPQRTEDIARVFS